MKRYLTGGILRIIVFFLIVLQVMVINVSAKDNVLSIYKNNPEDSIPFSVTGMFPGDCETNTYTIRVSYNGDIKIYFKANVRSGEKLAEVLMCKVVMGDNNQLLYDGVMKEMPDLEHSLSAVNRTEDLKYVISVYLDKSVDNDYQNKELVADFEWWVYTSDEGYSGGGGTIKPIIPPSGEDKPVIPPDENEPSDLPTDNAQRPEGESTTSKDAQRPTGELINPPKTGDSTNPILWIVLICISLFVIFLFTFFKKRKRETKQERNPIMKKLTACIVIIVILAICLCITTFALVRYTVNLDKNIFKTGTVNINLNDDAPIIKQGEFLFEPGMTVIKDFFIENESSDSVYYKIYFDNVNGGLEKVLDVKIVDKETGAKLYDGKAEDLIRENCHSEKLLINERRILTAEFHYPEDSGNETQNLSMSFDMCAVATQEKNNPNKEFD